MTKAYTRTDLAVRSYRAGLPLKKGWKYPMEVNELQQRQAALHHITSLIEQERDGIKEIFPPVGIKLSRAQFELQSAVQFLETQLILKGI